MASREIDLGRVQGIESESIGVPGQRTFRLNAYSPGGAARLWLEKEQLRALAVAIEQFLAELPEATRAEPAPLSANFPALPDYEFHIGRLALGYDQDSDLITMMIREISEDPDLEEDEDNEEDDEEGTALRFQAGREQMRALAKQALNVVASGRPLCPLCHQPLDGPTHFCPRRNGHSPLHDEEE